MNNISNASDLARKNWQSFRDDLPYKKEPYSKRSWGNNLHSLCSYQGKLKPAIAHFLISEFTDENMTILDTFSGVGTIPFEGAMQNRKTIGNDLSLIAYANTLAKIGVKDYDEVYKTVEELNEYILKNVPSKKEIKSIKIDFNKDIQEYYSEHTFKQIVSARDYFLKKPIKNPNEAFVFSSLLHILHGNRPYALSRTSHPITPFAPKGEFIEKDLIEKLLEKVNRAVKSQEGIDIEEGKVIHSPFEHLEDKIENESVDSIITSPPFFASTRFYLANWIRLWFCGWEKKDFNIEKEKFLETKQVKNIDIYAEYFEVCNHVLKKGGTLIMHLGVSKKANMGEMILPFSEKYFNLIGMFIEDVKEGEKFGIRDQGTVNGHQFMFLEKK